MKKHSSLIGIIALAAVIVFTFSVLSLTVMSLTSCDNGTTSEGGGGGDYYKIGDTGPGGGKIFYLDADDEYDWTYLEAAPVDIGPVRWSSTDDYIATTDFGDGKENTALILAAYPDDTAANNAAIACAEYTNNGFTDWFLPTLGDWGAIYNSLIRDKTGHGFKYEEFYWSSSNLNSYQVMGYTFHEGSLAYNSVSKSGAHYARPVRAIYGNAPPAVATPSATLPAGTYEGARSVTLSCATAGATIYYTLDGSVPKASSTEYSGPIAISESATLKARAVKAGMMSSSILSLAYTITNSDGPPLSYSGGTLPSGTVNIIYSQSLATATGAVDISYDLAWGSSLPLGLDLSPDGMLTGMPTAFIDNWTFSVTASAPGYTSATATFTITINMAGGIDSFEDLLALLSKDPIDNDELVSVGLGGKNITGLTGSPGYEGCMPDFGFLLLIYTGQTQGTFDALVTKAEALSGESMTDLEGEENMIIKTCEYMDGEETYICEIDYFQAEINDGIIFPAGTVLILFGIM